MTPPVEEILALLGGFDPGDDARAAQSVERTLELLRLDGDPFSRTRYEPGHLTASGVVLAPQRDRVLLVYHRRLARWLQPGGHIEPADATLASAARREIFEETGLTVEDGPAALVAVDVHAIPPGAGEPGHQHYDLMFCFTARQTSPGPLGPGARWCGIGELDRHAVDQPLRQGVARALGR